MAIEKREYQEFLVQIKNRIQTAQIRAVLTVNADLIYLYWDIGRMIDKRQKTEGWGAGVIPKLAKDIQNELPEIKGFSKRNIGRMIAFFKEYPKLDTILPQPVAKLEERNHSLKGAHDEEFKTIFLNNRNRLLAIETMQTGTVNKSVIYPRKIVERALYNHAANVIIAHNHPGESLNPSEDDCKVTKIIRDALKTVDIILLDHIIIGGDSYFSFKENGLEV